MNSLIEQLRKILLKSFFMGHLLATVFLLYLPCVLFLGAETEGGRWVGLAAVQLLVGLLSLWLLTFRRLRFLTALLVAGLFSGSIYELNLAVKLAPKGSPSNGNFSQIFAGNTQFSTTALSTIVPEIDQLKLGSHVATLLDPFVDDAKGNRIRSLFLEIYREMRKDPAFVNTGSALGMCYEDLFLNKRKTPHFYQYVPRHLNRDTYPVLVFLHGSLGNFKGYMWVLKKLADTEGYAIIAPTYGAGNWSHDKNSSVAQAVYEHCLKEPSLNENSLFLSGLSNGGTGLTREIKNHGQRYQGFIFISPVMEPSVITSADFIKNVADKPILIVHGEEDLRIPVASIRAREKAFRNMNLSVTSHYYPNEDHFLFFSQKNAVLRDISEGLKIMQPTQ